MSEYLEMKKPQKHFRGFIFNYALCIVNYELN